MQILLVPDREMQAFLDTGLVDGGWETYQDDSRAFLRSSEFEPYLTASIPKLAGRIGRVFVWWRDDYDYGECDLDETLVLVDGGAEEGAWLHNVDALVVETRSGDIEMGEARANF